MKCEHGLKHFLMNIVTTVTVIAVFLHMASHVIPVLITNNAIHDAIVPFLHHPLLVIVAWSFLPVFVLHLWKDKRIHTEMHRLQKENEKLKNENANIGS